MSSLNSSAQKRVPASIFRAYDIRGVVDEQLTEQSVRLIGQAVGSAALASGESSIAVGRDGRLSGPHLATALIEGVRAAGCNIIDLGMVPTPVVYFAAATLPDTHSGIAVTGSHNPPNYNGFKIVLGGVTLANEAISDLYHRIRDDDLAEGHGDYRAHDIRPTYLERILGDVQLDRSLKAVVDCGNGVTGELGPELIRKLGVDTIPLFDDIDGRFPNHHPDPGKFENLTDLIAKVRETGADIGLAFDGDGDRVGVVTPAGEIIYPDRLLMAFADDLLKRQPGARIIFDIKCTGNLIDIIESRGGTPEMWRTGHSLIKARMKETGAQLAGEMSGHIFFGERWYGFDDGLYAAARLLEILSRETGSADDYFARFPQDHGTAEINVRVTDDNKFDIVKRLARDTDFGNHATKTTLDGIRVDYPDCWGLCRASNTTPMLVFRFEGRTPEALDRVRDRFREALRSAAPEIEPDF
ncbi:phosphomannomutase/phosphoglucomutase [Kushneria phosphatilytica]|uniref:phosphomannomutase n=1 Tax=Kushneria phosphatilytica TaxID=657387 RepID=A0A1S1NVI0_9GAMM|nr:phosphomannomutase/phosphoglucomutase [Kushneria phosphatilytica]OHV10907.1 phosphomannomutase/phosphoglucomutase [Kushneria phosphatilytica]QEL12007.1 phosphomannomutase/phosphoglucomutase [Kushneria phosphatilytica]